MSIVSELVIVYAARRQVGKNGARKKDRSVSSGTRSIMVGAIMIIVEIIAVKEREIDIETCPYTTYTVLFSLFLYSPLSSPLSVFRLLSFCFLHTSRSLGFCNYRFSAARPRVL